MAGSLFNYAFAKFLNAIQSPNTMDEPLCELVLSLFKMHKTTYCIFYLYVLDGKYKPSAC